MATVAARECLPPGTNVSVAAPANRQSDQFCNQGIFHDFGHGAWTNPWESFRLPPLLIPYPTLPHSHPISPSTLPYPTPSLPLEEVGPLNPATRPGECCRLPQGVRRRAPADIEFGTVHFSLKILHVVATNLKIFLKINCSNFMQNLYILTRIWKHVNSAKY